MVAFCSFEDSSDRVRLLPTPPSWFFIVLAFAITAVVACKSHSFTLQNDRSFASEEKSSKKSKKVVGRKAAEKYFKKDTKPEGGDVAGPARSSDDHFMALHFGTFFSDKAFRWGNTSSKKDVGNLIAGVSYRIGEWSRSMDLLFRGEFINYDLPEGEASKISLMPMIQFPEASSRFPLYFGAGLGLGLFTKQIADESQLSLDYQIVGGGRLFDIFRNTGFFAEIGVKNHFLIFSEGQFNSFFLSLGTVFTF